MLQSGVPSKSLKTTSNSGWIALEITAAEAEQLFRTNYYEYDDPVREGTRVACDSYMLPEELVRHVDYVVPGVTESPPLKRHEAPGKAQTLQRRSFPSRPQGSKYSSPEAINCTDGQHPQHHPNICNCSNEITPDCIRALYHIPSGMYSSVAH
jgi:tripeptidyl-peptidase-1